jgi:hypothetical protein
MLQVKEAAAAISLNKNHPLMRPQLLEIIRSNLEIKMIL